MQNPVNNTLDNIRIGVEKVIDENNKLKLLIDKIEEIVDYNYNLYGFNAENNLLIIRKHIKEFKNGTSKMQ